MSPSITQGSPISQIIAKFGSLLKPIEDPTSKLTYDAYSLPQREAFNLWTRNDFRPQFEYETLNPWMRNWGNDSAVSNRWMMGNAKKVFNQNLSGIERGYQDRLAQAQSAYEDMLRQGYNQQIKTMGNSPTQMTNI